MTGTNPPERETAYKVLTGGHPAIRWGRRMFRAMPADPRCKLCASPFRGPLAPLLRAVGKGPWPKNPRYCGACFKQLATKREGAEVSCSLLFADVRGSTELAEQMRPAEFQELMGRFYEVGTDVLVKHDGIVDKFVGDEIIGIFIPALTGELHAERAIAAGRELLRATGRRDGAAWLPVGVGVNTGIAYVGAVGSGDNMEFSAMGDPVNVTARLASAAGPGELLVTTAAAEAAQLRDADAERRTLTVKGKHEPIEVLVFAA